MKHVLRLRDDVETRIETLIELGRCRSIQQFVERAIDNQLTWEFDTGTEEMGDLSDKRVTSSISTRLQEMEISDVLTAQIKIPAKTPILTPLNSERPPGPFWGQYYRFLPVKFALRVLASSSIDSPPSLNEFRAKAASLAMNYKDILKFQEIESGVPTGKKLSTGFPDKTEKSRKRYQDQYACLLRSGGNLDGFAFLLGFIDKVSEGQFDRIALTQDGWDFARIESPPIDLKNYSFSLSDEEASFLLKLIMAKIHGEKEHIAVSMDLLGRGDISRLDFASAMAEFYDAHSSSGHSASKKVVETMSAGLLSRLIELGLVTRIRDSAGLRYRIAEKGIELRNSEGGG